MRQDRCDQLDKPEQRFVKNGLHAAAVFMIGVFNINDVFGKIHIE